MVMAVAMAAHHHHHHHHHSSQNSLSSAIPSCHGGSSSSANPSFHGGSSSSANPSFHGGTHLPKWQSLPLHRLATGITAASGFVKGLKAAISVFHSLHGDPLVGFGPDAGLFIGLKAAKIITKAVKVSKTISRKRISNGDSEAAAKELADKLSTVVKGCKAFYGAFTVLQFAKTVGVQFDVVSMLNWKFFMTGYKLSKSLVNVMELVVGFGGGIATSVGNSFLVMKGTVKGISVMMKAAFLSKELCIFLLKAFGISRGSMAAFESIFEALSDRHSHAYLSNRVRCIPVKEGEMDILLRAVRHKSSLFSKSERSSSSIMLLVNTLTDAHKNLATHHCVESDHFLTFSLAVPMPRIE